MQNESLKKSDFDVRVFQVSKWNHPIKGDVSILTDPETLEKFICCETITSSLRELHVIQNYLNRLLTLRENFNGMLIDYSIEVKRRKSNVFFIIKEYYIHIEHAMKDYLTDDINQEILDSESLCHIFYQIIRIMGNLQDRGVFHGYINPACILVTSPNRFGIHLISSTIVSSKQSYFDNLKLKPDINISPELLKDLNSGFLTDISLYKNDAFCFGLTILQLALKKDYIDIYVKHQIDNKILESNYLKFSEKFNENRLIVTSVKAMLNLNESLRPDFRKLTNILPGYEKIVKYFNYMNKMKKSRSQQVSEKLGTPSFVNDNKSTSKEGFISFFDYKDSKKENKEFNIASTEIRKLKPINNNSKENLDLIQTTNKNRLDTDLNYNQNEDENNFILDLSKIDDFEEKLDKNMKEFDMALNTRTAEIDLDNKKFKQKIKVKDDLVQILKKSFVDTNSKPKKDKSNDNKTKDTIQTRKDFKKRVSTESAVSLNTSKERLNNTKKKYKMLDLYRRSFNEEKSPDTKLVRGEKLTPKNPLFTKKFDLTRNYKSLTKSKLF